MSFVFSNLNVTYPCVCVCVCVCMCMCVCLHLLYFLFSEFLTCVVQWLLLFPDNSRSVAPAPPELCHCRWRVQKTKLAIVMEPLPLSRASRASHFLASLHSAPTNSSQFYLNVYHVWLAGPHVSKWSQPVQGFPADPCLCLVRCYASSAHYWV